MEVSYLCAARQADVLAMQKSQLLEEGIFIRQGKTGEKQIKAWSGRLMAAMELAKNLPLKDGVSSVYALHQKTGAVIRGMDLIVGGIRLARMRSRNSRTCFLILHSMI